MKSFTEFVSEQNDDGKSPAIKYLDRVMPLKPKPPADPADVKPDDASPSPRPFAPKRSRYSHMRSNRY